MATLSLAHPAPTATRFWVIAWSLLALWLVAWLAGPSLVSAIGVSIHPQGHAHLHAHGHPFVDARSWWGVPNTLDVLSNLPLVFVGGMGLAVAFAGVLGLAMAERVGQAPARLTLPVALLLAIVSAFLPWTHGNVLPWAVVQFGGIALIVWAAMRPPVDGALGVQLWMLIAAYALAKLLELGDAAVYLAAGEWVSGHSLKHVAAACAALPILWGLRQHGLGDNAPVRPMVKG
ncbi:hypothetical protein [Hydrogenophaga sp.]|uniref:hypothetical protein n=1 Tax=Hydrogenophaga sp. TaxID=1904254 RepID=UPI002730E2C0|nr:hypothetical protein [Hydrogenophaga sp.]MDP2016726.1 hypothetical protein [Hydrogenophaga sp.]MDP3168257.1 hypothetical protein [Hydrogenophaga sp.]